MTKPAITNAYLEGRDVVLQRRAADGRLETRRVVAEHSLFVKAAQLPEPVKRSLRTSRNVVGCRLEGDYVRVRYPDKHVRSAGVSWLAKLDIEAFEGDVDPIRRLLADTGITIAKPRRAFIDFEWDSRVKKADMKDARILCWTITNQQCEVVARGMLEEDTDVDEARVLREAWSVLDDYDQIVAWYGDFADFPVFQARSMRVGAQPARPFKSWRWMDLAEAYKRHWRIRADGDEKTSMKLGDVCMHVIGETKNDFDAALTWDFWLAGGAKRKQLGDYCAQDTLLLPKLDNKTGVLSLVDALCEACQVFPDSNGLLPTELVDGAMLRLGVTRGVHFKTRHYIKDAKKFEGAFVMEPKLLGILKNVEVADFSAMYPSIMISWNMSPETIDQSVVPTSGAIPPGFSRAPRTRVAFRTDVEGFLPILLREFLRLRKYWTDLAATLTPGSEEWKDARQKSDAYKVASNACYGVSGTQFSRFYERKVAESTSTTGAWLINEILAEATARKMFGIYGDTDSCMVQTDPKSFSAFVDWCNKEFLPRVARDHGCVESLLKIAHEKGFSRLVMCGKKRYAGRIAHYKGTKADPKKPALEIKGLEFRRGDAALLARQLQKTIIDKLLIDESEDPIDFEPIIEKMRDHVLTADLGVESAQLAKYLKKPLEQYARKRKNDGEWAAQPPHVEVARKIAEAGGDIGAGSQIAYVVVNDLTKDYISAKDYKGIVDRHHLWEQVWKPTLRVLAVTFPGHPWKAMYSKTRPKKDACEEQTKLFEDTLHNPEHDEEDDEFDE